MLTTDTAIHSNTQQYKVLYYYTIHSTGLRIASAGSVVEEVQEVGVVVRSLGQNVDTPDVGISIEFSRTHGHQLKRLALYQLSFPFISNRVGCMFFYFWGFIL